ncbi:MAG: lactonase family protein [Thermomicrobiales bacterium]
MFVYVGAYTEPSMGHGDGISIYRFDENSGALTPLTTMTGIANPSYLTIAPNGRYLYAVNELIDGSVTAFAREPQTGTLTELNWQSTHGAHPCYLTFDRSARFLLVANYSGETVAVLPLASDGRVEPASCVVRHEGSSVNPNRQEKAHPHMIAPSPDGLFVLATDLGADRVFVYEFDSSAGQLVPNRCGPGFVAAEPGSGPRHFAFAPNGRTVYVINELASTLTVYDFNRDTGELRRRQTDSSLPADFEGDNWCAQVLVSPDGRFVYGSNREHDRITIWSVDQATGEVTTIGYESTRGKWPRSFALDPTGNWLLAANEKSDSLSAFRRHRDSGTLMATGGLTPNPTPVAIAFHQD